MIIYGEGTPPRVSNIADTAVSNSAGEAMFNLNYMHKAGQAGVAVLNIQRTKTSLEVLLLWEAISLKWLNKLRTVKQYLFKINAQFNLQMKSNLWWVAFLVLIRFTENQTKRLSLN